MPRADVQYDKLYFDKKNTLKSERTIDFLIFFSPHAFHPVLSQSVHRTATYRVSTL